MKLRAVFVVILILAAATGCASEPAPTPTPTPSPPLPPPPDPTEIPPTEIPPTEYPPGVLFRDDFNDSLMEGWAWWNENPENHWFEDGYLVIIGEEDGFYGQSNDNLRNFLTYDLPEGDFVITARVTADPDEDFEQATLYIFQDGDNYIALNTGYCSLCRTGGPGVYMETVIDNNPFPDNFQNYRDPRKLDILLKLVNLNDTLTGYYAYGDAPETWYEAGAFGNFFDFIYVGVASMNLGDSETPLEARFDYFEISEP